MALFDFDDTAPARARSGGRTRAKPRPKRKPDAMPGLAAPFKPLPWTRPDWKRIEDVSLRIRQRENADYGFRCDAVTHTAIVMLYRQYELALSTENGRLCHAGMDDELLVEVFADGHRALQSLHGPVLLPTQPLWRPDNLRAWAKLWEGVDMIGRLGPLEEDVISLVYQASYPMNAKQKGLGAFITPYNLCRVMAQIVVSSRPWAQTVSEPCVGSGALLVAYWDVLRCQLNDLQRDGVITPDESHRFVVQWVRGIGAQDIDAEACWTSAVQLSVRTGVTVTARHPHRIDPDVERVRKMLDVLRQMTEEAS